MLQKTLHLFTTIGFTTSCIISQGFKQNDIAMSLFILGIFFSSLSLTHPKYILVLLISLLQLHFANILKIIIIIIIGSFSLLLFLF